MPLSSEKSSQGRFWRASSGVAIAAGFWWFIPQPDALLLPPLGQIFAALIELASSNALWQDIQHSLIRVLCGVFIATCAAIFLGLLGLLSRRAIDGFVGIFELMRPIPPIAWTPVAILFFGIGSTPAIAIVAISSFFPLWLSLLEGIDTINDKHIISGRCLGASPLILFTDVQLPSILPKFLHGLRLAIGIGWFSVIAAEMVGASTGLGHAVQNSTLNLEMTKTYSYLLVIGIVGFLCSWLVQKLTEVVRQNWTAC